MIEIRYIGRKAWAVDPVAGSGVVWDGHDDVQPMTISQARKILKHPDEWELANAEDASRLEVQTLHQTLDEHGKTTEVDEQDLAKPVDKMTRSELKVHAKLKYGRDIPATMSRAHMLDAIEEFEKTVNPINSMPSEAELAQGPQAELEGGPQIAPAAQDPQ